jgi:uncharacterized protein YukE
MYGHLAKDCDNICKECRNLHQGGICIFSLVSYYKRLYHACKKIVEINQIDKMKEIIQECGPKTMKLQKKKYFDKLLKDEAKQNSKQILPVFQTEFQIYPRYANLKVTHFEIQQTVQHTKSQCEGIIMKLQFEKEDIFEKLRKEWNSKIKNELFKRAFEINMEIKQLRTYQQRISVTNNNGKGEVFLQASEYKLNTSCLSRHKRSNPGGANQKLNPNRKNCVNTEEKQVVQFSNTEIEIPWTTSTQKILNKAKQEINKINEIIKDTTRQKRLAAYNRERNLNKEVEQMQKKKEQLSDKIDQMDDRLQDLHENKRSMIQKWKRKAVLRLNKKIQKCENQYKRLQAARTIQRMKYNRFNDRKNDFYHYMNHELKNNKKWKWMPPDEYKKYCQEQSEKCRKLRGNEQSTS